MIALLLFVVQHAAALALLLLIAAATGTAVAGGRTPLALRSVLGLAVAGQVLVVMGTLGVLHPWSLCALGVIALVAGAARTDWNSLPWRGIGLAMLAGVPLFVLALYPPIAFDETLYHLPFVQAIAESGAIRFLPGLRFPAFPQFHELLCVPGFLALGDVATHLVAVAEVLLLAALLIEWVPGRAGFLAAAIVVGSPIVVHHATITYVEGAMMLFITAGFYCLDRALRSGWRSIAAAGFFLGTAYGVKYLAAYFAAGALAYVLFLGPNRWRRVAIFLAMLLAGALPMASRIVAFTGNPVFPFMTGVFGTTAWVLQPTENAQPVVRTLRLFWDVTFAREFLNQQPPYSPLFALSALITIFAARRDRWAAFLCILSAGYIALFIGIMPRDSRYLLPLLPLMGIAAARVLVPWRRFTIALSLLSIAVGLAYTGYRLVLLGPPPVNAAQRERFLERRIPEYRALKRRGPGRIYVCHAEQLQYFGGGDVLGDFAGLAPFGQVFSAGDAGELSRTLSRFGVRDLLVSRRACPPEWKRLAAPPFFERVYADDGAVLWRLVPPATEP